MGTHVLQWMLALPDCVPRSGPGSLQAMKWAVALLLAKLFLLIQLNCASVCFLIVQLKDCERQLFLLLFYKLLLKLFRLR